MTAINAIGWYGRRDKLWPILKDCDDETFKLVVEHQYLLTKLPEGLEPRVMTTYKQLLWETEDLNQRLQILLRMGDLDGPESVLLLKADVERYSVQGGADSGFSVLHKAVAKIASEDPDWASEWVAKKQAEGKLYQDRWSALIGTVPSGIIDGVIQELIQLECPENKALRVRDLIGRGASKEHARTILHTLVEKYQQIVKTKGQISEEKRKLYWRLKDAARALSWQTLMEVLLEDYSEPGDTSQLKVILDVVGCAALERNIMQAEVSRDALVKFSTTLRGYSKHILAANDYGGQLKADLSCALGLFGEAEDMGLIRKLIDADIDRVRRGLELHRQGAHTDPCPIVIDICKH